MNLQLTKTIEEIGTILVPEERKSILKPLTEYIQFKIDNQQDIRINFICTHNSRRSHFGQIWMQTLAHYFKLKNMFCYSGGTETTALAEPVINTLENQGFQIQKLCETKNTIHSIKFDDNTLPIIGFSKEYFNDFNPKSDFAAIMTCSQADEGCPFVAGTEKRIAITYQDPKEFDNTDQENEKYMERSKQIAAEMYFVLSELKF